ncbi:MAG: ABC transporter permease [Opitutaceae bacterium]
MNPLPILSAPPAPVIVVANLRHAFGGVWRLTFRRFLLPSRWLTVMVGLVVLTLLSFAFARGASTGHYVNWLGTFYVTFLVPSLAFIAAAGAMRDEMKSSTVDYVLTRPLPRPAFVIFKFIAHTACAQIDFFLALMVVLVVGHLRGLAGLAAAAPQLLVGQVLLVLAASAFGFLCAILTSRYIVLGLAYAGIVEAGLGQIPTQLSRLSLTRQIRDLLDPASGIVSAGATLGTAGFILVFTGVALAAAAAVFHMRELAAPAES